MIKIGVKNQIKKTTDAAPHFRFACSVVLSRAVSSEPDFFSKKKFIISLSDDGRGRPAPSLMMFLFFLLLSRSGINSSLCVCEGPDQLFNC
jgi:hypothetical protein